MPPRFSHSKLGYPLQGESPKRVMVELAEIGQSLIDREKTRAGMCPTCDNTGDICPECKEPWPTRCKCGVNGASLDGCPECCAAQRRAYGF